MRCQNFQTKVMSYQRVGFCQNKRSKVSQECLILQWNFLKLSLIFFCCFVKDSTNHFPFSSKFYLYIFLSFQQQRTINYKNLININTFIVMLCYFLHGLYFVLSGEKEHWIVNFTITLPKVILTRSLIHWHIIKSWLVGVK